MSTNISGYYKLFCIALCFTTFIPKAKADIIYNPVSIQIRTDKPSYIEGEKITFIVTLKNSDQNHEHPVLLPHTQNTGQKLLYFNAYDKAENELLLRYSEDKMLNMMVHDTGTVQIRYLKPLEQIEFPIFLNDSENYFNYHTQNASHHSFGVPIFAGIYRINLTYNPKGIALGDSLYEYYNDFDKPREFQGKKMLFQENGIVSNMIDLEIRRTTDSVVSIERTKYFIKTDGHRYYYFLEPMKEINTDYRLVHVTNIPQGESKVENEYFYSQFKDKWNEYFSRFPDGNLKEYRKFINTCPNYLYTVKFNEDKIKVLFACQLFDGRFYEVQYRPEDGRIAQESYCAADGSICNATTYVYNKEGMLIRKKESTYKPCEVELLDGE